MNYDPTKHHRHSIRLKGYDYSQPGAYFITVVTHGRECLFGEIVDGGMQLSNEGHIVNAVWHNIPNHFPSVELGVYTIMPNHIHGIIILPDEPRRGVVTTPRSGISRLGKGTEKLMDEPVMSSNRQYNLGDETSPLRRPTLGQVVAYFKYQSTKQINNVINSAGIPIWQRNYYEHIIRDENEHQRIRNYILANPINWISDDENPDQR